MNTTRKADVSLTLNQFTYVAILNTFKMKNAKDALNTGFQCHLSLKANAYK